MAENIERDKRSRTAHRSHVRRLMSQAEQLLLIFDPLNGEHRQKVKHYKSMLMKKSGVISELDKVLLDASKADDIENEIEETSEFMDAISLSLVALEELKIDEEQSQQISHEQNTSSISFSTSKVRARLPKLRLSTFDGKSTEWSPFWDNFESIIDSNNELNDVDKFSYLKASVRGSAASTINGLPQSGANYSVAVSLLKERYGDSQKIISSHMDALVKLPPITNAKDLKAVRQLSDDVDAHMRALEALGCKPEQYGELFLSLLLNKIPKEIRLDICSKVKKENWNFPSVLTQLKEELANRERCEFVAGWSPKQHRDDDKREHFGKNSWNKGLPTTAAFMVGDEHEQEREQGKVPTCVYCAQPHSPVHCSVVTDIQKRKEILMKSGRCFTCIMKNHISRNCHSKTRCNKCQGRHHASICQPKEKPKENHKPPPKGQDNGEGETRTSATMCVGTKTAVLLQTAKAAIYRPDLPHCKRTVRIILDGGSQRSYITERVRKEMNLTMTHTESLTIKPFGSSSGTSQVCEVVDVCISVDGDTDVKLSAISVPLISAPVQGQRLKQAVKSFPHLSKLRLADDCDGDAQIDMLVGADQYWNFVTGGVIREKSGPAAIHTKLGWVLSGPVNGISSQESSSTNLNTTHVLKCEVTSRPTSGSLDNELQRFWQLESLGIAPNENSVYDTFQQRISFDGKKYEVSLPWREPHPILHDNYKSSKKRLAALLTRLKKEPKVLKEYDSVVKEQLQRGIVEQITKTEAGEVGEVHYLPHHPVIRRDKETTKVRVVYDASSKESGGPSLNECLYTGPSLTENIADILMRFRAHKIALVGDIEKAFLMISVAEDDRDVLRFLWVDDPLKQDPETIELRFTRVTFGLSSSPFLLNATLKHHISIYESEDPEFVQKLLQSLYVDDIVFGDDKEDDAYELYTKTKMRLAEGGFNARKFVSNSRSLMEKIRKNEEVLDSTVTEDEVPSKKSKEDNTNQVTEEDESYAKCMTGPQNVCPVSEKMLGVQWCKEEDSFVLDYKQFLDETTAEESTKRDVVRVTSRIYDPVGFITPVTVKLKLFCQSLCKKNLRWDEVLDDESKNDWMSLQRELKRSEAIHIPRCYLDGVRGEVITASLQGFCDASVDAYAAVVYLRLVTTDGVYVKLLTSKTRVAPLVKQTILRLELLSALILARLVTHARESLKGFVEISSIRCWSDSEVALYWIVGETREWKQFVQNRVLEIRSLVPPEMWSHCPGKENPADIPSRGTSPTELLKSIWFTEPEWLRLNKEPVKKSSTTEAEPPAETLKEMKVKERVTYHTESSSLVNTCGQSQVSTVIDCKRFSSWKTLLRTTAVVLQFIERLKAKKNNDSRTQPSLVESIVYAEELWVRDVQLNLGANTKYKTWEREFGLYTDDKGILRCRGRLENTDLVETQKHPAILDAKHYVTSLIVKESHGRVKHNGVKETLTEVRTKFWIIRGRQYVRKELHKCNVCRRQEGKPYRPPEAPALPAFRVTKDHPFTYTGVDFAGPLYVKESGTMQKTYMVIYTCGVSRAVHLDIVPDLTAEAFSRSFRRFTARRGIPLEMKSDNGKTFKAASKSLATLFDLPEVRKFLTDTRVRWTFNLEKAPWWGGFFERLIKSVKRCLKKVLGNARVTREELYTVLTEIEATLNSRPLTYISTEDVEEPMTPSHLIHGRRVLSLPDQPDTNEEVELDQVDGMTLARRMAYLKTLKEHFWLRWKKEYLLELRNAHRQKKVNGNENIKIGDVVVIHDDNIRRVLWKLGRVENLIEGKDGSVRGAVVRTMTAKQGRPTTLRRPVQKLYPLEQCHEENENNPNKENRKEIENEVSDEVMTNEEREDVRPKRAAARKAERRRRKLIKDGRL